MAATASGMRAFLILWAGQFVSLAGSALTAFGLAVHVYEETGSVTQLGVVNLCIFLPLIAASPTAGTLVDRWGSHRALLVSSVGAMAVAMVLAALLATQSLSVWAIYIAIAVNSVLYALQMPAFGAALPLLVPKEHIGRANGLTLLASSTSQVLAPVVAGVLLLAINIEGIVLIDGISFAAAIGTLLVVRIPRPQPTETTDETAPAPSGGFGESWRYVRARRGLVGLLVFFAVLNFSVGFVDVLITPLVLAFASPKELGLVMSIGGIGMVVCSLVMSVWGGPRRRAQAVLGFSLVLGFAVILGSLRPSIPLVAVAAFLFLGSSVFINASSRAIWQTKVDPGMQGRVLALHNMAATSSQPLAYLLVGPLADGVFQPLVGRESVSSPALATLVGSGAGRGLALMLIVMGVLIVVTTACGFAYPRLRRLDDEIPDAIPASIPDHADEAAEAGVTAVAV